MAGDIDPAVWELQAKLVYSVLVAGKSATFADAVIRRMLLWDEYPFDTIGENIRLGLLPEWIRGARAGCSSMAR